MYCVSREYLRGRWNTGTSLGGLDTTTSNGSGNYKLSNHLIMEGWVDGVN